MTEILLVNKNDQVLGTEDKLKVHQLGLLHRAFSIFIFNSSDELLLQRRALHKYHSGGLWTNTCCSHQGPGESLESAVHKRLMEEMGMVCELKEVFSFLYRAELDNNLIENELDHVFVGISDKKPAPNPDEVAEYKYISLKELKADIIVNPNNYTEWFKIIIEKYFNNDKMLEIKK